MTDYEVMDLLNRINEEVVSRGIGKTASLPKMSYIAGKDLPAGRYIYNCKAIGNDWRNLTVKADG